MAESSAAQRCTHYCTGISDAVAETVVDLGIDWTGIETLSDLQTGLITALSSVGIRLMQ